MFCCSKKSESGICVAFIDCAFHVIIRILSSDISDHFALDVELGLNSAGIFELGEELYFYDKHLQECFGVFSRRKSGNDTFS